MKVRFSWDKGEIEEMRSFPFLCQYDRTLTKYRIINTETGCVSEWEDIPLNNWGNLCYLDLDKLYELRYPANYKDFGGLFQPNRPGLVQSRQSTLWEMFAMQEEKGRSMGFQVNARS